MARVIGAEPWEGKGFGLTLAVSSARRQAALKSFEELQAGLGPIWEMNRPGGERQST